MKKWEQAPNDEGNPSAQALEIGIPCLRIGFVSLCEDFSPSPCKPGGYTFLVSVLSTEPQEPMMNAMARRGLSAISTLVAIIRQRCPRCRQGRVFSGRTKMNETCPQCGLRFEREQGYFMGAMYFSYPLSIPILGLLILIGHLLLPSWRIEWIIGLASLGFLPFVAPTFRYSRILWMYFERWANPNF